MSQIKEEFVCFLPQFFISLSLFIIIFFIVEAYLFSGKSNMFLSLILVSSVCLVLASNCIYSFPVILEKKYRYVNKSPKWSFNLE